MKQKYLHILLKVIIGVLLLWLVEALGVMAGQKRWLMDNLGLAPWDIGRWWGVFTFHLVHSDLSHLVSNSLSLIPLGLGFIYFYPKSSPIAFLGILFFTGLGMWLVGEQGTNHIGASGIVYGLAAFLVANGLFRKDAGGLAIALIVIVYYQGMFWSLLSDIPGVSWEGHFFGALSGALMSYFTRNTEEAPFDSIFKPKFLPSPDAPKTFFLPRDIFDKTTLEREIEAWLNTSGSKIGTDLHVASLLLRHGQIVGIPTETVYGLAANALDERAVVKIFEAKNRPAFDPLIVHVSSIKMAEEFVSGFPEKARILASKFWPGPLTLLLPKNEKISDLVTSGNSLVGLRVPNHNLTLKLIEMCGLPLAAPSANPFGYISPTRAQHVADQLSGRVAYILDGGACEVGVESTIVGFDNDGEPIIYRKGGLPVEAIEAEVGKPLVMEHSSSNPKAPGMLKSHYAPRIPFLLGNLEELVIENQGKKIAVLSFKTHFQSIDPNKMVVLSPSGNMGEAAQRLFAAMRYLDSTDADLILAELLPEEGLGRAINDRLRRAAAL